MMHKRWGLASGVMLLVFGSGCGRGPKVDALQVTAKFVRGELPREDPAAAAWDSVTEHPAKLMVQDVVEPRLIEPGVEVVRVRAIHNGEWVVFRLEWEDPSRDLIPASNLTSDAAAIQFPAMAGADVPDAAMGEKGKGVRIWYWKAVWQDDAERARDGKGDRIAALYPNATIDHYPFEAGGGARAEMEKRYAPARAAGNPNLERPSTVPVQVVTAEGFGDTTVAARQSATGRGIWNKGSWAVTIARPLDFGAEGAYLEPGKRGYAAYAVWDGAKSHAGSRKMRSGWIPLVLEGK